MPPLFACVFSLLLSQAYAVMRTSQVVSADGDVRPIKPEAGGSLLDEVVKMAVDASGQSQPQMDDADGIFESRVKNMLSDIQEMARSGVTPEPAKIRTIKSIVEEELVPNLKATRDSAEKQNGINLDGVKKCNTNNAETKQKIKSSTEAATGTARTEHAQCRTDEKDKTSTKDDKCKQLDDFLDGINPPETMPADKTDRPEMVGYVKAMSDYFCPKKTVKELDQACTAAEDEHAKHREGCHRKQAVFESDFCTWRTELTDACGALDTCYKSALKLYTDFKKDTSDLIENKWKIEFQALKKISCYVDVWLSDDNANTVDAGKLSECDSKTIDTTPMDIDFGTPDAEAKCSLAAVQNYPGTDGFRTTEYAAFNDYVTDVINCLTVAASSD